MANKARDDFPLTVKRTIALRVNYRCSNPICGANTSGPQVDADKSLSIGVAAHITAASSGGPRYNANLSEEQRKSPENGIWLCQNCAKQIDNDPPRFTEDLLYHWKQAAEQCALDQIGRRSPFDKTDAPRLEVVAEVAGQAPLAASVEWRKPELIDDLLTLVATDIKTGGQARLLARGQGAHGNSYAIIGLGSNYDCDWTVIFFTAGEFGWEMVARTSLDSQKGWTPEVLYVPGTPGAMAITHVHGWGTGVFRRSTSWYRIAKGEPVPMLSYPHSFYINGWGMPFGRKLTCKLLSAPPLLRTGLSLDLEFEVEYSIGSEFVEDSSGSVLFSRAEKLSLEWIDAANTFVPCTSKDDFARIEELWLEGTDGFIRRNAEILENLALSGTEQQRHFIREHLFGHGKTA